MLVEEINTVIDWYKSLPIGYNHINELIHNRKVLSTYLTSYQTMVSEFRRNLAVAIAEYDNKKSKLVFNNLSQGIGKAEIIAKVNTQKELRVLEECKGMYDSHKENIKSVNEVLSTMSQHIAIARDELARLYHVKS